MPYTQPEITVLGRSSDLVQASCEKQATCDDGGGHSGSAYELDE